MARKSTKPRKHVPSAAEIANDSSVKWTPYRRLELLWSDEKNAYVRFLEYDEDGRIRIASYEGMADLGESVDPLRTRRLTGNWTKEDFEKTGQDRKDRTIPSIGRTGVTRRVESLFSGGSSMKKKEIVVGRRYVAKVGGKITTVRVNEIVEINPVSNASRLLGARRRQTTTSYRCTNLSTGREVAFRSAAKFHREITNVPPETTPRRSGLESKLSDLASDARSGVVAPEEHDRRHADIVHQEGERRASAH